MEDQNTVDPTYQKALARSLEEVEDLDLREKALLNEIEKVRRDRQRHTGLVKSMIAVLALPESDPLLARANAVVEKQSKSRPHRVRATDAVLKVFEQAPKQRFHTDQVAETLAAMNIKIGDKSIYNALNHLARSGRLHRVRPGVYRLPNGAVVETTDDLDIDPNEGEPDT